MAGSSSVMRSLPLLVLLSLLPATRAAAAGEVVSVDAALSVAPPSLPQPKLGGRDLAHCFGEAAGQVMRDEILRELQDLKAFRAYPDEGGDYRLAIDVTRVTQSFREMPSEGEAPSTFEMSLEARCTWSRAGETDLGIPLLLTRKISLDGAPGRRELQGMLRGLFRELGQRAFGELYETRYHRAIGGGTR